jgi:hypothetical protein
MIRGQVSEREEEEDIRETHESGLVTFRRWGGEEGDVLNGLTPK